MEFVWCFLIPGMSLCLLPGNSTKTMKYPSQCKEFMMLICLTICGVYPAHLVKVVSGFLHCKFITFLFVVDRYLGEDTLRLCKSWLSFKFHSVILVSSCGFHLQQGKVVHFPYVCMYLFTGIYFIYELKSSIINFYFVAQMVPALAISSSLRVACMVFQQIFILF